MLQFIDDRRLKNKACNYLNILLELASVFCVNDNLNYLLEIEEVL